tara:strand:- start:1517 stop:1762 length:246 start_codon:yes stop_codon:yes gene_type:complete
MQNQESLSDAEVAEAIALYKNVKKIESDCVDNITNPAFKDNVFGTTEEVEDSYSGDLWMTIQMLKGREDWSLSEIRPDLFA